MMDFDNQITAIIKLLESVRQRKGMYLDPVDGRAAENFVNGTSCVLAAMGVYDREQCWNRTVAVRGWKVRATKLVPQMQARGLSDEQIADEILAIEAESWRLWQTGYENR